MAITLDACHAGEIIRAYQYKYFLPSTINDDWKEVNNYIQALNTAIDELKTLAVSLWLIKQTHPILMAGYRGDQCARCRLRS